MTCRCWFKPCGWLASRTTGSLLISAEATLGLLITRSLWFAGRGALFCVRICVLAVRRCPRSQLGCAGLQRGHVLANSGSLCRVPVPTVPDVPSEFICRSRRCRIFTIDCCLDPSRCLLSTSPVSDSIVMRVHRSDLAGPISIQSGPPSVMSRVSRYP